MNPTEAIEYLCDLICELTDAATPVLGVKKANEIKTKAENIKSAVVGAASETAE